MPYDGNGNYTVPGGTPAIPGDVISSVSYNTFLADLMSALSNQLTRDGQAVPTANLAMGGYKLTGLGAGSGNGDSLRYQQLFSQGTPQNLASAATTDVGGVLSNFVNITGTTTITSFGTNYNGPRFLVFEGSLLLTHNASTLILPGGANIQTQPGDTAIAVPKGSPANGWLVSLFQRGVGSDSMPIGAVLGFGRNTPPDGWLVCNGQAVSRTTYADLFSAIGTFFGPGDGVSTFNLPEIRGEFPRGWDAGRGVDPGRVFGSWQNQAIQSHDHAINATTGPDTDRLGFMNTAAGDKANPLGRTYETGGTETRPRNIALLFCIKARVTTPTTSGDGSETFNIVTETGTSRTITTADSGVNSYMRFTNAGLVTVTFDVAENYGTGMAFSIRAVGAAGLDLDEVGVTLTPPKGGTLHLEQNDTVTVVFTSPSTADVFGSTEAAP